MGKGIWLLPIFGALIGGLLVVLTAVGAKSAPQEAAGYAMALAFAVVPYVLARSVMAMTDKAWEADVKAMRKALETMRDSATPD